MRLEYKTTHHRMTAGQPMPAPVPPAGEGWKLHQTVAGHDPEGKPALVWTWQRAINEGSDEELTQ